MNDHDNTVAFREAFNRIESYLRHRGNYDNWKDFSSILKDQAKSDSNLRRFVDELDAMRELRNLLVHREGVDKEPIANPNPVTIERLSEIYKELTHPPTVETIMIKNVSITNSGRLLSQELQLMQEKCFTVLPVLEDQRIIAVLSEYSLLKWCSDKLEADGAVLEARLVGDIHDYLDIPNMNDSSAAYAFVPRRATISEVRELFDKALRNNIRLNAVFVTENGKHTEGLLGLITSWDIT